MSATMPQSHSGYYLPDAQSVHIRETITQNQCFLAVQSRLQAVQNVPLAFNNLSGY